MASGCQDLTISSPMLTICPFDEYTSSKRFSMMTDKPKVTSRVVNGSRSMLFWMSVRCTT
jgi:hypothetical protein